MSCRHEVVELRDGDYYCEDCGVKVRRLEGSHGSIYVEDTDV